MSGKHANSVFYQGMYIINVFHVILYINIYFAQTRLCMVIVVNRRFDVSNAISSEISMDRKLAWVENCTGNYTFRARGYKPYSNSSSSLCSSLIFHAHQSFFFSFEFEHSVKAKLEHETVLN